MDCDQKLRIVNSEPDLQKRLGLLVKHGFKFEAGQLIRGMARLHTAMFHYDWHDEDFCKPLPRVTKRGSGGAVYVMITTNSGFNYHPAQRREGEQHIIFELGWEQKVLGWDEVETRKFVRSILEKAFVRPLSQWSFKQAEGTGRASRQWLPADGRMVKEIAALHLVFQLREADFGRICSHLALIEGCPFDAGCGVNKPLDETAVVSWIVDKLLSLGWNRDQIRKEFAEWIWLKTGTPAQWLLAVAKAKVFCHNDRVLATAVHRWIRARFEDLLRISSHGEYSEPDSHRKMLEGVWHELFVIGQLGVDDSEWIRDLLVAQVASGKLRSTLWFLGHFGSDVGLHGITYIRDRAIDVAVKAGNYGVAVALFRLGGKTPDPDWVEIVKIRGLSTKLDQD